MSGWNAAGTAEIIAELVVITCKLNQQFLRGLIINRDVPAAPRHGLMAE
ncbi:MAG: hypothetical protein ACR2PX_07565 [Endozoicomonas sp.]